MSWGLRVLHAPAEPTREQSEYIGSSLHAFSQAWGMLWSEPVNADFGWWRYKMLGLTSLANIAFGISLLCSLVFPRLLVPHLVLAALVGLGLMWMTVVPLVGEGSLSWGYYVWEGSMALLV